MRWIFLAVLLICIPLVSYYAKKGMQQRDHLLTAFGILFFSTGILSLDASVIGWPSWPGTSKGIILSFIDVIAVALLITRPSRAPLPPFLATSVLFLVPMLIASTLAATKIASVFSLFQIIQILFLYFVLAFELKRESAMRSLCLGIAIGLIVQACFVIQQKLSGVVQASGATAHQNILGMMVQLGVLPLLAAVMEGMRSKVIYAGIIAGAICIAGGGSRASIGFFAVGLSLYLLLSLIRRSTSRKWAIVGVGFAAAAVFVPLTFNTLQDRFGEREIAAGDKSRDDLERAARAIAVDYPLGVGPNNFVTINNIEGYAERAGVDWGAGTLDKPVHNAYLLARSETGWAGQLALVLLLANVALAGVRTSFRSRNLPQVGIALGSACAVTAIALHSNYEYAWYMPEIQRLFFVNAALIAGCIATAEKKNRDNRNARRLRTAARSGALAIEAEPAKRH